MLARVIGSVKRLRYDVFCVKWVGCKPLLNHSVSHSPYRSMCGCFFVNVTVVISAVQSGCCYCVCVLRCSYIHGDASQPMQQCSIVTLLICRTSCLNCKTVSMRTFHVYDMCICIWWWPMFKKTCATTEKTLKVTSFGFWKKNVKEHMCRFIRPLSHFNVAFSGLRFKPCLQCFDAVGWAAGRASGL